MLLRGSTFLQVKSCAGSRPLTTVLATVQQGHSGYSGNGPSSDPRNSSPCSSWRAELIAEERGTVSTVFSSMGRPLDSGLLVLPESFGVPSAVPRLANFFVCIYIYTPNYTPRT